jgi:hypothetical protein
VKSKRKDMDDILECIEKGVHLTSCDDDGFCNNCGEQESEEEFKDRL